MLPQKSPVALFCLARASSTCSYSLLTFTQDEAEQSLRLQETYLREFTLIDGNCKRAPHKFRVYRLQMFRLRVERLERAAAPPTANTSHDEAAGAGVRYSGTSKSVVRCSCTALQADGYILSTLKSPLLLSAQDISKDAAKFVSDALDIYLQVRSLCCVCAAFDVTSHGLLSETHSKDDQHQGHFKVSFPYDFR
jgi:hypothetical protein